MGEGAFKIVVLTEGLHHSIETFDTSKERDAYESGFHDGACAYGAGQAACIPWEALDDPEWFDGEFADSFYKITIESVRKGAKWEPERQGQVDFDG